MESPGGGGGRGETDSCFSFSNLLSCFRAGAGPTTPALVGSKISSSMVKALYFQSSGRTNNCQIEVFFKWSDPSCTPLCFGENYTSFEISKVVSRAPFVCLLHRRSLAEPRLSAFLQGRTRWRFRKARSVVGRRQTFRYLWLFYCITRSQIKGMSMNEYNKLFLFLHMKLFAWSQFQTLLQR